MNTQDRKKWLETLTTKQLRALASQNEVKDWATLPLAKLISMLSLIEDVSQPRPTLVTE